MPASSRRSSRRRFADYLELRRKRLAEARAAGVEPPEPDKPVKRRARNFFSLFAAFWTLLRGHRSRVIASLGTLTVTSLLALVFPASIKVALDYILNERPGPAGIPRWAPIPD